MSLPETEPKAELEEASRIRIPLFAWVVAVTIFGFTLAWLLA